MDEKIRRMLQGVRILILFCVQAPQRGSTDKKMTGGAVNIGAGTMYGPLSKMEKDGLLSFYSEEKNSTISLRFRQSFPISPSKLKVTGMPAKPKPVGEGYAFSWPINLIYAKKGSSVTAEVTAKY